MPYNFKVRYVSYFLIVLSAGAGLFLFFSQNRHFVYTLPSNLASESAVTNPADLLKPPPANSDIPNQKPLRESLPAGRQAPEIIKAVYATGWSAGNTQRINYLIDLIKKTELNAIVIDIKDYSGNLSYRTNLELTNKYGAEKEVKIQRPNALIKKLHDEGIYVIARQTVFQDPVLAMARPDLALTSSSTGKQWKDRKGVMWVDPAAKEVWDYNIAIAEDALARGFDEINFDYIRFASDGKMTDIIYPAWDEKTPMAETIRQFFRYLRKQLGDAILSADLFGYTTLLYDDLGIGQVIENAYSYFDYIAPMVYPSHYNPGFLGYKNPALYPYEVVYKSILEANERLKHYLINAEVSTSTEYYLVKKPQLRPWLQDFDLGATYDAQMIRSEINAVYAAATGTPIGWMLWDPANNYTRSALMTSD